VSEKQRLPALCGDALGRWRRATASTRQQPLRVRVYRRSDGRIVRPVRFRGEIYFRVVRGAADTARSDQPRQYP